MEESALAESSPPTSPSSRSERSRDIQTELNVSSVSQISNDETNPHALISCDITFDAPDDERNTKGVKISQVGRTNNDLKDANASDFEQSGERKNWANTSTQSESTKMTTMSTLYDTDAEILDNTKDAIIGTTLDQSATERSHFIVKDKSVPDGSGIVKGGGNNKPYQGTLQMAHLPPSPSAASLSAPPSPSAASLGARASSPSPAGEPAGETSSQGSEIERLRQLLRDRNHSIATLYEEIASLKGKVNNLEVDAPRANGPNDDKIHSLKKENHRLKEREKRNQTKIQALTQEIEQMETRATEHGGHSNETENRTQQQHQNRIKELTEEIEALKKAADSHDTTKKVAGRDTDEVQELTQQIETMKIVAEAHDRLKGSEIRNLERINELTEEVEAMKASAENHVAEKETLSKEMSLKMEAIRFLNEEREEQKEKETTNLAKIKELSVEVETLQQNTEKKSQTVSSLKAEVKKLRSENEAFAALIVDYEEEVEKGKVSVKEKEVECAALSKEVGELQEEKATPVGTQPTDIPQLESQLSKSKADYLAACEERDVLLKTESTLKEKILSLEKQVAQIPELEEKLLKSQSYLEKVLQTEGMTQDVLKNELVSVKSKLETVEMKREEAETKLATSEAALHAAHREKDEMETKLLISESACLTARFEKDKVLETEALAQDALKKEVSRLRIWLDASEKEKLSMANQFQQDLRKKDSLLRNVPSFMSEDQSTCNSHAAEEEKDGALQESLRREVSSLKSKLDYLEREKEDMARQYKQELQRKENKIRELRSSHVRSSSNRLAEMGEEQIVRISQVAELDQEMEELRMSLKERDAEISELKQRLRSTVLASSTDIKQPDREDSWKLMADSMSASVKMLSGFREVVKEGKSCTTPKNDVEHIEDSRCLRK